MLYEVERTVTITCTVEEFNSESFYENYKCALRMQPDKIVVEIKAKEK